MKKLWGLVIMTVCTANILFGFGGKPADVVIEQTVERENIHMVVKPFDTRLVTGGQTSLIPRFYDNKQNLQKPVLTNLTIIVDNEEIYSENEGDFWTKYNFIDYDNGEHTINVTAVDESGYGWSYTTNFIVSNITATVKVTLATVVEDEWRDVYLTGNSETLGYDGTEWDPRGALMTKIDDYTYETEIAVGMYENVSFGVTLGNMAIFGLTEKGQNAGTTVKFTNDNTLVEIPVDNWGMTEGELTGRGYVVGFTDYGSELEIVYTHPEETNVTLYFSYSPESYWEPVKSESTQFSDYVITFKPNRTLYFYFSDNTEVTNEFEIQWMNNPYEFVVIGDVKNSSTDITQAVADNESPAFVLDTGDLVPSGYSLSDWSSFLDTYMSPITEKFFYQPVPGNHEEESPVYNDITGKPSWYSFSWAGSYFIALDDSAPIQEGSPQYEWLKTELLAAQYYPYLFVYTHYSPYSTRMHGNYEPSHETLIPLFEEYGVDVVFSGHDHGYEASYPLTDGEIDEENGVVYVVCAGGGATLYESEYDAEWSRFNAAVNHYVRVTVDNKEALFECVDADGNIIDSFIVYP